jgi:hypothetical protein
MWTNFSEFFRNVELHVISKWSCYWIACCVATYMHTEPCLTVWSSDCQVSRMCRKNIGDYTTPWSTKGVCRLTYITVHLDMCKVQWLTFHAERFNLHFNKPFCKDNCWLYLALVLNEWMRMVHWWNDTDSGKPKYFKKNLSLRHFSHNNSHVDWPRIEPEPMWWEASA